jgi:GNAT superfamily N-acetyltransferase
MPTTDKAMEWKLESLAYPLNDSAQRELIALLRTEWTRTDYDWVEAMSGDYSERLVIISFLARRAGEPLATATVHFNRQHPEVAVIGGVLTHRNHRDRGLAGRVIEIALERAKAAGCGVCLLGTARRPHNVYRHHGFAWQNGKVMRCVLGAADLEAQYFAAGQQAVVRAANWGDLPGVTLFAAQPIATICLDYPHGLYSGRYVPAERCLSNFPVLWYDTAAAGGLFEVLAGPDDGRIFGFGTLTPSTSSARRHMATIDFATHDNYEAQMPTLLARLLDGCRTRKIQRVEAMVPSGDEAKLACLRAAGFTPLALLPGTLQLTSGPADVHLLSRTM